MLYQDRTEVNKGIDVNEVSATKECIICPYRYILDKEFKLNQPSSMSVLY